MALDRALTGFFWRFRLALQFKKPVILQSKPSALFFQLNNFNGRRAYVYTKFAFAFKKIENQNLYCYLANWYLVDYESSDKVTR